MNNFVVAITRTCGSGGMSIGKLLCELMSGEYRFRQAMNA